MVPPHPARGRGGGRGRGGNRGRGTRASQPNEPSSRKGVAEEEQVPRQGGSFEATNKNTNGSYHCDYFKRTSKCDLCGHINETRTVFSSHFKVKHSIAGHNVHLPATQKVKTKWFIYLEECEHPEGIYQYVGSTDSMTHRWANTKSKCKSISRGENVKSGTGLEKHVKNGCSQFK